MPSLFRLCGALGIVVAVASLSQIFAGCSSNPANGDTGTGVRNVEVGKRGPVEGVGIAGHDIVSMTNQMARDILSSVAIMGNGTAHPRIIIDSQYFTVQGSQPLNRDLISQRLLVELNRAAATRIVFVGRRHADMVGDERELKRDGAVDSGGKPATSKQLGADFRLAATFGTLDTFQGRTGMQQRYTQVVFELVDLESGAVAWTGLYEIERAGADDVVYR